MTEIFLAFRDGVGLNSTLLLEGVPTLIKDLPKGLYHLFHGNSPIAQDLGPQSIPGFLLHYCTDLERENFKFKGESVYERISNLEISLERASKN